MVMQTAPEDNNTTVHRNVITFLGAYQIMRKLYGLIGVLFHYLDAYQEYEKSVRHSQVYRKYTIEATYQIGTKETRKS